MRLLGAIGLALLASGCVSYYQPLQGLQRPVLVDLEANDTFANTAVHLRCHPTEAADHTKLCRNLRTLLTKQGATVTTELVRPQGARDTGAPPEQKPQYVIDVKGTLVSRTDGFWWRLLNIVSLTLVPAISEAVFTQDLSVHDAEGFLLAHETLHERFVYAFGLGIWAINGLVDLGKPVEERVTGAAARNEFTKDFHGRLSQLLYNARNRARVMRNFEPEPPVGARP